MGFPKTPAVTVDCVIFDSQSRVLLIRRKNDPFKGAFALPGGFVDLGETVEAGCRREVHEETGLDVGDLQLVGVYSDPHRDPRGHTVSMAFLAKLPAAPTPVAGDDAASAAWVGDWRAHTLAFDHAQILVDAEKLAERGAPGAAQGTPQEG
ncbi:MAG: NUDIX domain-containing protein [Alphaproteobacteria bacterium]|jgi:8-oxo-dGTP diphosphatase